MTALERAETTSAELLRLALLAKLAVDLGDPVLCRRAARHAVTAARFLSGSDFPAYVNSDDTDALPTVGDLLPSRDTERES